ncbi:MAG TPA: hypothetical protein VEC37_10585 [Bacillota bacterium]|nr:hypothetical protein [Bacillota bacterium]
MSYRFRKIRYCLIWLEIGLIVCSIMGITPFENGTVFGAGSEKIRVEAETMKLSGYRVESNRSASGGGIIRNDLEDGQLAVAAVNFKGQTGYYDISVCYFDESDGISRYKLWIDGQWLDIWNACRDRGDDSPSPVSLVGRLVQNVTLHTGAEIKIYGSKSKGEYGRIDYLEFIPSVTQPNNSVQNGPTTPEIGAHFNLDEQGYVHNWYRLGPIYTSYRGNPGSEKLARDQVLKRTKPLLAPVTTKTFQRIVPQGEAWELYASGRNCFVEDYRFFYNLTISDFYGLTDLIVEQPIKVKARLWSTRGAVDLWHNGRHLDRKLATSTGISYKEVILSLKQGVNRIFIRQLDLGARNTPQLFGLQILTGKEQVKVGLPGAQQRVTQFYQAERWLYTVDWNSSGRLVANLPPPVKVKVQSEKRQTSWEQGQREFSLREWATQFNPFKLELTVYLPEDTVARTIELPQYAPRMRSERMTTIAHHRAAYLQLLLNKLHNSESAAALLIKRMFNQPIEVKTLKKVLQLIDNRVDCSDFQLAGILRLYHQGNLPAEARELIRQTALRFRYWSDETGTDAMAMTSENHQLLFHGDQLLAGLLFPEDRFSRSRRTGKEQAQIARTRIHLWLERVETEGFEEFLSNAYAPVTAGALLNLIDFAEDPQISNRAARLLDRIFDQLAQHSFDGVTSGPQGRIYRAGVLYPENGGTQALLSYATPLANLSLNEWVTFLGSSGYRIPENLDTLLSQSVAKRYLQGGAEIVLKKTGDYILSSVALPSPSGRPAYTPGTRGRQEHLWEAALSGTARIFVTHPGAFYEESSSRPAYWNGNGIQPVLRQTGNILMEIFNIPADYPVQFTHAHWPADQLDQTILQGHWVFGRKANRYAALWCSEKLEPSGDIVVGREWRSYGGKVAWLCMVSSEVDSGSFADFMAGCQKLNLELDQGKMSLSLNGQPQLAW